MAHDRYNFYFLFWVFFALIFFQDAVKTLSIKGYVEGHDCLESNDLEENATKKYYEH